MRSTILSYIVEELPSGSKPVNDTLSRRVLTLAAIRLLGRLCPRQGNVLFLSRRLCVKYSRYQDLAEAATIQFVAQHTSIPVPKVHCAFRHNGWTYIVMDRIDGEMLCRGWRRRTPESKARILSQLKDMVADMRRIPRPIGRGLGVSNVDGRTLFDARIAGTSLRFGPFKTVQDFHRHLRRGVEAHPDHLPEVRELIAQHDEPWPLPCFTHADLSSLNILARGDKFVGIVDWETAGWYPSYWEYTTAWNVNPRNNVWQEEIHKFLEPRPKELAMEILRLKHFGDIPY